MTQYALIMLAAGIGIPLLAALNSALGKTVGSPAAAAMALFAVALITALSATVTTGTFALLRLAEAPWYLFLAGVLIAFYVLSITYIAPRFGVGNAVFFVLLGQLISAAIIDHFGLFGARTNPLSLTRTSGIIVIGLGVWITQLT